MTRVVVHFNSGDVNFEIENKDREVIQFLTGLVADIDTEDAVEHVLRVERRFNEEGLKKTKDGIAYPQTAQ